MTEDKFHCGAIRNQNAKLPTSIWATLGRVRGRSGNGYGGGLRIRIPPVSAFALSKVGAYLILPVFTFIRMKAGTLIGSSRTHSSDFRREDRETRVGNANMRALQAVLMTMESKDRKAMPQKQERQGNTHEGSDLNNHD